MRIRPRKPHSPAIGEGTKSFNNVQQRFTHFVFVGQRFLDPRPATGAQIRYIVAASHCRQLEGRCRRGRREGITRGGPNPTTDATLNIHFVGLDDRPEPRAGPDDGRTACFRFDGGRWQPSDLIGRRVNVAINFLGPTVIHGAGNLGWRSDPQTARYRPCWTTITDDREPGGAIKEGGPGGGSDSSGTFPDSCDRR